MELFDTPLQTNKLLFKNRLVMPPMATAKCEDDGSINEEILQYYDEKTANGKIALVIVEHAFVLNQGRARQKQISMAEDDKIAGAKRLCDILHKNGTLCCMQINHAGSSADAAASHMPVVGPSDVADVRSGTVPAAMTEEQIREVVDAFAAAAARVRAAGCDAVEIHSAHGYLLNQFYSPYTNRRTDAYGGDIAGRIRLHLEVVRAVRKAVGEAYPIFLRLGAKDYVVEGSTVEDGVFAAKALERAGVDLLDITGGIGGYTNPQSTAPGFFADASAAIKKAVSIPVLVTGGVRKKADGETLLRSGAGDLIGVGRAMLQDSHWVEREWGA